MCVRVCEILTSLEIQYSKGLLFIAAIFHVIAFISVVELLDELLNIVEALLGTAFDVRMLRNPSITMILTVVRTNIGDNEFAVFAALACMLRK